MSRSVEAEGTTVEEATKNALVELGLSEGDAVTVEVLSEGKRGLFGGGKRAHVRVTPADEESGSTAREPDGAREAPARVPATDEPVAEREGAKELEEPAGDAESGDADEISPQERLDRHDEEADLAADFVERLLDLMDLPGDIEIEVHEDHALVNVLEVGSGLLIGRRGATLDALQELVRCAVQRQTERRTHVRVDVEGYRERQLEKLRAKCRDGIAQVRETGKPYKLEPMDAYERKMMHDLVASTGGVRSASEGAEPKRRVVIHPE